MILLSLDR
jgi:AbrB family looped-hinge helix DNA binding protein